MRCQLIKICQVDTLSEEFFKNDAGDFPVGITLVTLPDTSNIVRSMVDRILSFLTQAEESVEVSLAACKEMFFEDESLTLLHPTTLILILDYGTDTEKMITLELASTREELSIH